MAIDYISVIDRSLRIVLYREDPFQVLLPISLLLIPPTWMNPSTTHNLHAHTTHPSIRVSRLSFSSFLYFFSVELAPIFFFYPPFWVIWGVRSTLNMREREKSNGANEISIQYVGRRTSQGRSYFIIGFGSFRLLLLLFFGGFMLLCCRL